METATETMNGTGKVQHVETAMEKLHRSRQYMADGTLIKGTDYGIIPGFNKPTLLKPGAQKLCALFELAPIVKDVHRSVGEKMAMFEVTYQVVSKKTGGIEGEGLGACNSMERKYKNLPVYDIANTVLKMAGKRALVDAVLNALGVSSIFTQDVEDLRELGEANGRQQEPARRNGHANGAANGAARQQQAPRQQQAIDPNSERWDIDNLASEELESLGRYLKAEVPSHPQRSAVNIEVKRRRAAAEAMNTAPAQAVNPQSAPTTTRAARLAHRCSGMAGFAGFVEGCHATGQPWANDWHLSQFEEAAGRIAQMPVTVENQTNDDWLSWEASLADGTLTWAGVAS